MHLHTYIDLSFYLSSFLAEAVFSEAIGSVSGGEGCSGGGGLVVTPTPRSSCAPKQAANCRYGLAFFL